VGQIAQESADLIEGNAIASVLTAQGQVATKFDPFPAFRQSDLAAQAVTIE